MRGIEPGDVEAYRAVRLRALREDTQAFSSTHAREAAFDRAEWTRRVARMAPSGDGRGFLAWRDGVCVGMIGVFPGDAAEEAWIVSVWVAPEVRRLGVGAALLAAALAWAPTLGVRRVMLQVAAGNAAAIAMYVAQGFVDTGGREANPNDRSITECLYTRPLDD